MDAVLTALALFGALLVIFGEGTRRMTPIRERREELWDRLRGLARALRLQPDVEALGPRYHGLHALGRLVRSVALEPRANLGIVFEVGLRRPTPIALRARRPRGASSRLEFLSPRVLAAEALLDQRLEALLARELATLGAVEIERDRVCLFVTDLPADADAARSLLVALAEVAEAVEARAVDLEAPTHRAHRLGFLPAARPLDPRTLELHTGAASTTRRAHLDLTAHTITLRSDDAPALTIDLRRPLRIVFSRSHDAAGRALFHLELRQRSDDATWQRLTLSSRTDTFAARVDRLRVQAHRAPFVPEPLMLDLLAALRHALEGRGEELDVG